MANRVYAHVKEAYDVAVEKCIVPAIVAQCNRNNVPGTPIELSVLLNWVTLMSTKVNQYTLMSKSTSQKVMADVMATGGISESLFSASMHFWMYLEDDITAGDTAWWLYRSAVLTISGYEDSGVFGIMLKDLLTKDELVAKPVYIFAILISIFGLSDQHRTAIEDELGLGE